MTIQEIFRSISERLQSTATVNAVYGDAVSAEGKTIIPVAKVRYGFGGGFGEGRAPSQNGADSHESEGMGGGGGGGVEVTPVGIIEITPGETRYISFEDKRRLIRAGVIVLLMGMFLFRRRRRRG